MRWVYIGAGLLALSASCYMAVMASGGIQSPSAPALIAMAVILGVGAAAVGTAVAGSHIGLAIVICLGMLAGEGGAMIQTAQRVTAAREASRAPIVALELKRKSALDELAGAKAAKSPPEDRSRLITAEKAKLETENAVREQASDKGCRENCRLLLQAAVEAARREVEAAREDIARREADRSLAIANRIEIAKAAVAALPPPRSPTPLADYTGVAEWVYDVIEALTLSFSINLPASALIALGVKMGRKPEEENRPKDTMKAIELEEVAHQAESYQKPLLLSPRPSKRRNPAEEAEQFGLARLRPDRNNRLSPAELRAAYIGWCGEIERDPLPIEKIAPELGKLFRRAGIEVANGYAVGVTIHHLKERADGVASSVREMS